jgi:hypothetical protein
MRGTGEIHPTQRTAPETRARLKTFHGPNDGHGGGRKKTSAFEKAFRAHARKVLEDGWVRRRVWEKFRDGTINPQIYIMYLWYAYGKPAERVETTTSAQVKIVFEMPPGIAPPAPMPVIDLPKGPKRLKLPVAPPADVSE